MNSAAITDFEVVCEGFEFCEAPCVDGQGRAYFSDLLGGGFYRCASGAAPETLLSERIWIGGAVLDEGGGVVVSGRGGLVLVENGAARPLLSEIDGRRIIAINDIEGDGRGGLFGGTADFEAIFERGEAPQPNTLFFHLDPSGRVTVLRDDVVVSNGIGFSPDGTLLYHSESTVGVWVWRIGEDGLPRDREMFAKVDDCDGMVVDAEGCLWVAFWREAVIRRYRPDGSIERTIKLPYPHLVSMAFGGEDMRDLYIATGGNSDHPGKGGVVRIRTEVPGLAAAKCRFGG